MNQFQLESKDLCVGAKCSPRLFIPWLRYINCVSPILNVTFLNTQIYNDSILHVAASVDDVKPEVVIWIYIVWFFVVMQYLVMHPRGTFLSATTILTTIECLSKVLLLCIKVLDDSIKWVCDTYYRLLHTLRPFRRK